MPTPSISSGSMPQGVYDAVVQRLQHLEKTPVTLDLVGRGGLGKMLGKMSAAPKGTEKRSRGGSNMAATESILRIAAASSSVVKAWKALLKAS